MTTAIATTAILQDPALVDLVDELIAAIEDLNGLDRLDHHRLEALAEAAECGPGHAGDFGVACRAAWELARPPLEEDLDELSDWIDWHGDDCPVPPSVDLDQVVEALAEEHAELLAEVRSIAEGSVAA